MWEWIKKMVMDEDLCSDLGEKSSADEDWAHEELVQTGWDFAPRREWLLQSIPLVMAIILIGGVIFYGCGSYRVGFYKIRARTMEGNELVATYIEGEDELVKYTWNLYGAQGTTINLPENLSYIIGFALENQMEVVKLPRQFREFHEEEMVALVEEAIYTYLEAETIFSILDVDDNRYVILENE